MLAKSKHQRCKTQNIKNSCQRIFTQCTVRKEKDPVRTPSLQDKTARDSPKMYEKIPHKSPRVRLMQPRTFRAKTPQKGDSNGESIDESDVDLQVT